MNHPEREHQNAFFVWLRMNEETHPVLKRFFAIPNGGMRTRATAVGLFKEGVKRGVLDTFLPAISHDSIYPGLWIEFKAGQNILTAEQVEWKQFLESQGYLVHVVYEWTEAARITVKYLGITLPLPHSSPAVDEFRRRRCK